MTDKSHVGMGYKMCPCCHERHDEVVLLDKRLRNRLERDNFMGWALCPKHDAMKDEYVALVEVTGNPNQGSARFTGGVAHVRWHVAEQLFRDHVKREHPWMFVEAGVIAKLQAMTEAAP